MEEKSMPGDGVVTGTGIVDGRVVAAFSQDFTVGGGALGRTHSKKICDMMDYALKTGCPIIGFNDSGGARIQEGFDSLSAYGQVFFRNVLVVGCRAADCDCGRTLRGRGRLFAGVDGFYHHGQRQRQHVYLRTRSDPGCDRREMHNGSNRQHHGPCQHQRQYSFRRRERRGRDPDRPASSHLLAVQQPARSAAPAAAADGPERRS